MVDSPDDFEIVDRSDIAGDSDSPESSETESTWSEDFEVGSGTDVESGLTNDSIFTRIRGFFRLLIVSGRSSESGIEIVDSDFHDSPDSFAFRKSGHNDESLDENRPRVIEVKVVNSSIAARANSRVSKSKIDPDADEKTNSPIPVSGHGSSDNAALMPSGRTEWVEDTFEEGFLEPDEVIIAQTTMDVKRLSWLELLSLPLVSVRWIVTKLIRRKTRDEIADDFAVASKRRHFLDRNGDLEAHIENANVSPIAPELPGPDIDELKIGTSSIARKILDSRMEDQNEVNPDHANETDEYSVGSASRRGGPSYFPGKGISSDFETSSPAIERSGEISDSSEFDETLLHSVSNQTSTISGRLQNYFDSSDRTGSTERNDEPLEVGVPVDSDAGPPAIRPESLGRLILRIVFWFVTIPKRCLIAEGDLFEQRRRKIEPLLAAVPAILGLVSLLVMISGISDVDKFESAESSARRSKRLFGSGNFEAAKLSAIRSCLENPTPDHRYGIAWFHSKSEDPVESSLGLRLIRHLASPGGGNQSDAHVFVADEILRRIGQDPGSNRTLFYRYLSELRAAFESSPTRFDILERLAEGLMLVGEDRSLAGYLNPNLEYWPHGHFFLAQVAFGKGDEELQKSHALAMVRHFRSTPAELEMEQKSRARFALSLAMAGEFSDAESFVLQMDKFPDDKKIRKDLSEKIDLIRVIMRINEIPTGSDQDIEVLGAFLDVDGLSENFESAIKRQLLRKGPLRPALVKLCRNLHDARKSSFDSDDYVFWASILRQNQQNDEAREYLENAVKLSPENDIALNNLANLLYKLEPVDLDRALSLSESVLKRNPKVQTFLETRGQILAKLGRNQEAIADLTKSLEAFPNVPEIHETLSRCYRNIGNAALADAHQKRYDEIKTSPESQVNTSPGKNES